jgi:RHS repeat-associated protein
MLQHNATYDAAGRIASIDSLLDGLTSYNHDSTDQLTGADHDGQTDESYSYDENGNRTMSGYATTDNNRLTTDGVYNYTYDDEGNRLTRTNIATGYWDEYTWDHRNRLVTITSKNNWGGITKTVDQTYDVFNQWIKRSVVSYGNPTPVETYFSHEGGQVALQFEGSTASSLSHRYLWGPAVDQLLADEKVTSLAAAGAVQYPLGDHLGTLRDLATYDAATDTTTIANHRQFDSYGNITSETNAAVDQLFGYTGRALDEATGLQNNLNRWYDSKTGHWLSEDPIGFLASDANLGRYVGNSPTSFVDASGLEGEEPWTSMGGWNPWSWPIIRHFPGLLSGYDQEWWRQLNRDNQAKARARERAMLAGDIAGYTDNMKMSPTQAQFCESAATTNYEVMAAGGPLGIAKSGVDDLLSGGPEHHLATNKNWVSEARGGPWSPKFESIFKKAGMTLDDAANRIRIPGHACPHPEAYHQEVFDRLTRATRGLSSDKYKDALLKELDRLGCEASTKGSKLNKLLTGQ